MARPFRFALKALATYVVMSVIVAIVMAEMTLHAGGKWKPNQARTANLYADYGAKLEPVELHAADDVRLRGWYSVPNYENGMAVILLHGIGDNRGGVAGYGYHFLAQGYRVLLPDSRAHGESEGGIATYGLRESDDIHRWVSWLYERGATCVYGFGESMGAALVVESLSAEPRFCAVVADSPFSTFRSVAYDREGYFIGAGRLGLETLVGRTIGFLPAQIAFAYAKGQYGVDLQQVSPLEALKSSETPVLLIHGDRDINILPRHSLILARANPSHTQLWLVPGAGHGGAVSVAPEEFWSRVLGFLAQHDTKPQPKDFVKVSHANADSSSLRSSE